MDEGNASKVAGRITGRGYSEADVRRWLKEGQTIRSIARKLGLDAREVSRWAKA